MRLKLQIFDIESVEFGSTTLLDGHHLVIDRQELIHQLSQDPAFATVDVQLALPGERKRVLNVLGITEPRAKGGHEGAMFPGLVSPLKLAGVGVTNVLRNVAVVEAGFVKPSKESDTRQGLIDMAGPLGGLTPFSKTLNIVLIPSPAPGVDRVEYIRAINRAGLKASVYLGKSATVDRPASPHATEVYELDVTGTRRGQLPRVAYICQVFWIADGWESFVYGATLRDLVPTLMHPNEFFDGAVVSCNYGSPPSIRNPTYAHQNNAIIRKLYDLHGRVLDFAGVVLTPQPSLGDAKERCSILTAKLAKHLLGADGVVVSKESGGHADVDTMLNCRNCEELGVRTVLLMDLLEGNELLCATPRADAIVSLGKSTEKVKGQKVDEVIGGDNLTGIGEEIHGEIEIPVSMIPCASSLFGDTYLTTVEY